VALGYQVAFFTFLTKYRKIDSNVALFRDKNAFMALAEKKFRNQILQTNQSMQPVDVLK
jgi:hypothetical protein